VSQNTSNDHARDWAVLAKAFGYGYAYGFNYDGAFGCAA